MENSRRARKPDRRYSAAFFGATTLAGIVAVYFVAAEAIQSARAQLWPQATGVVTRSFVHEKCSTKSRGVNAIVEYRYAVGGAELLGRYVGDCATREEAQEQVRVNAAGTSIRVHFDPSSPPTSLLESEVRRVHLGALGLSALFLVASAFAFCRELSMHRRTTSEEIRTAV